MKITETNLAKQLQNRNLKALDFLVDTYSNLLYKVIYKVLGSYDEKEIIEECLNDVLLAIWDNSNMFSGKPEKFIHWICVIAKYKAIDYQRKISKNKEVININDCVIASDFTTEDKILINENRKEILAYINEMNEIDRKIFLMRFYLEESINGIAVKLSVSRNVVDTRLSRGKKLLKQKLLSSQREETINEQYIQEI
ncbi:sigma-70 family RNA polymerase sigma factor [Clostridium cylindrosporum]|uniref:RNA polymerase sigma factor, sigma-70 family n=1 Tax=Clostridium cylindrosporum DSM 605 TaxID=1121307 RepID=A0A0J8D7A4_CLOCY|nr:sigma-70 family RNA polymerase sigma factor [Clostridium cylindrosporum]KMT21945.1 RNA polymerase sigma factor, sigma-70 family [Clostridium cylindrosporum DSM 605]